MPRFLVPCTVTAGWRRYVTGAHDADVLAEAATIAAPTPWTSDWRFETGPLSTNPVEDGHPDHRGARRRATTVRCSSVARRTLAVRAKDAAGARETAEKACEMFRDDVVAHSAPGSWHSGHADRTVRTGEPRRDDGPIRPRSSFEVDLRRLIAPNGHLRPLHLDQAFETYRWMVASAKGWKEPCRWHDQTVHHLLAGRAGGGGDESVPMVRSEADLLDRFQHAVLGVGWDLYDRWREAHGIHPTAVLTVKALHHGPNMERFDSNVRPDRMTWGGTLPAALWSLCSQAPGKRLSVQLNSVHAGAVVIEALGVRVSAAGFSLRLDYGFDGSRWSHDLASTRGGETFAETIDRGIAMFSRCCPDLQQQIDDGHAARRAAENAAFEARWAAIREAA